MFVPAVWLLLGVLLWTIKAQSRAPTVEKAQLSAADHQLPPGRAWGGALSREGGGVLTWVSPQVADSFLPSRKDKEKKAEKNPRSMHRTPAEIDKTRSASVSESACCGVRTAHCNRGLELLVVAVCFGGGLFAKISQRCKKSLSMTSSHQITS